VNDTGPAAKASGTGGADASAFSVVLVEDEGLLVLLMQDVVEELGYRLVGTATSVEKALDLLRRNRPHCVLLDVNLHGQKSYPVADYLMEQGTPFVFMTGYDTVDMDGKYRKIAVLHKPIDFEELREALSRLLKIGPLP
jgi:CheY-like chemotaxis protein